MSLRTTEHRSYGTKPHSLTCVQDSLNNSLYFILSSSQLPKQKSSFSMHTREVSHFTPTIALLSGTKLTACAKNQFNIFTDKKNNTQHLKIMRTAIIQTDRLVPNNYHKASFMNSYFLQWQASGYTEGCSNLLSSMRISFEPMSPLQTEST